MRHISAPANIAEFAGLACFAQHGGTMLQNLNHRHGVQVVKLVRGHIRSELGNAVLAAFERIGRFDPAVSFNDNDADRFSSDIVCADRIFEKHSENILKISHMSI